MIRYPEPVSRPERFIRPQYWKDPIAGLIIFYHGRTANTILRYTQDVHPRRNPVAKKRSVNTILLRKMTEKYPQKVNLAKPCSTRPVLTNFPRLRFISHVSLRLSSAQCNSHSGRRIPYACGEPYKMEPSCRIRAPFILFHEIILPSDVSKACKIRNIQHTSGLHPYGKFVHASLSVLPIPRCMAPSVSSLNLSGTHHAQYDIRA